MKGNVTKYNKINLKKNLRFKYKKKLDKDVVLNIGSKGFTLIELIATIAIISIISTVAIFSVTTLIKNSEEKSLQTTYSSLKETATILSKELPEDYWDFYRDKNGNVDTNFYVSCVSVKDMKNAGYYKDDDFDNKFNKNIEDKTFVIVKKDANSKVIVSSEIDENKYCSSNSFNNANLKVKSYTPSTITVETDCGSDTGYKYFYSYTNKSTGKKSEDMAGIGKSFTYSGLDANTKYDLNVTCSKTNGVEKHGNLEHTTGKVNVITFLNECTANDVPVTITYNDGKNYFFKLTSSGSIDSKYEAKECAKLDSDSCNTGVITYVKSNTWYMVNSSNIIVKINNNGTIYVYSSDNSDDIKFSSSLTSAITLIDKSVPNVPALITSDSITSGKWHKSNYDIILSNGESNKVNPKCKGVIYQISTNNVNFNDMSGTSKSFDSEENKTYYFRSKGKNNKYSESISYSSKLDKTKPICDFSNISNMRNTNTTSVTLTCTDKLSGVVSKKLSSSNFELKNISITNISEPTSITNGYKYTIGIKATATGSNSYIKIKKNIISDNAGNSNAVKRSSTFTILPNTYTINYDTNGCGSGCASKTVTYGGKYGKLCTLSKTGYNFSGWYTATIGGTKVTSSSTYNVEGNQTLYARCNAKTVKVTFNKNDGSGDTVSQSFTYGVSGNRFGYNTDGSYKWGNSGQFGSWDRSGYTMKGWSTSSNASSETYSTYSGVADGWINSNSPSITLYAVWIENTQTIDGYRCSGSDLYYITTCGLGTGICNYTYKNDSKIAGTVVRSNLDDKMTLCSNYQVNNSSTYTKTINRALSLVSSSNTIKILNDNTDSSSAIVSKNVTIDTNDKTVTRTSTINVNSGYTLTMNGTGRIINTSSRVFSVSGTLKIQGGTYETTGSSGNVDTIYLNGSGNIVLNDVNEINIWSDYGCGSAIMSDSSNSINVNATSAGIKLYGSCYGILAKDATVNVTSSYNNSIYGVTNWIEAIKGYAICAKNINFGSNNVYQDGSKYFNPGARSQSYTTNTSTFNVLYANGSINYKSGTLYSTYSYGKFQKDCYTSDSCNSFGSTYTYKPYYTGISDTIGSVEGSIFTNVTPNISWGYGQYFTSSYDTLALRIVKQNKFDY